MTLKQFLEALKTKNVLVTVSDKNGDELCKIYAEGFDSLDDTLEGRIVSRWQITGATALAVVVNDVVTTTDDTTDPDPSSDPTGDP